MENLSRLGILLGVFGFGLRPPEIAEPPAGDSRIEPKTFQSGDNAITSENRAEPRNTGIRVRPPGGLGPHHVEIGQGAVEPIIELFVGGKNFRPPGACRPARIPRRIRRLLVAQPFPELRFFSPSVARLDQLTSDKAIVRCLGARL